MFRIPRRYVAFQTIAWYGERITRNCHWFTSQQSTPFSPTARISVALIGPPNAGKSTLYNRLCKPQIAKLRSKKKLSGRLLVQKNPQHHVHGTALVSSVPGTTRDRKSTVGQIGDLEFDLIDTAGVDASITSSTNNHKKKHAQEEEWIPMALEQTQAAAKQADVVFLLIDGQLQHLTSDVWETAKWLRTIQPQQRPTKPTSASARTTCSTNTNHKEPTMSAGTKVVVLVNKLEGMVYGQEIPILDEISRLGFNDPPIPISALHGEGLSEVAAIIQQVMHDKQQQQQQLLQSAQSHHESNEERSYLDDSSVDTTTTLSTSDASVLSTTTPNEVDAPLKLAILGRINVGKSTLVNQLVQLYYHDTRHNNPNKISTSMDAASAPSPSPPPRVLAGPTPGLTRDAVRLELEWQPNQIIQLIDTAGIRKPSQYHRVSTTTVNSTAESTSAGLMRRVEEDVDAAANLERMAVQEAWYAVKTSDVIVLVLDAGAGILQRQELAICQAILQEGRALVIVANKMDLVLESDYSIKQFESDVRTQLETRFPLLQKTPIVAMSAVSGENVTSLLPVVWNARERWQRKITTSQLNQWLNDIQQVQPSPTITSKGKKKTKNSSTITSTTQSKKKAKIKYILQTKARPPTFMLFGNSDQLPNHYLRYLTRHFQDTFGLFGMPVRLIVKQSSSKKLNSSIANSTRKRPRERTRTCARIAPQKTTSRS